MNAEQLWQLSGWTMVHFLWIGTAIATLVAALRVPLRQAAPVIRYSVTLACFLALAATPLAIAAWLSTSIVPRTAASPEAFSPPSAVPREDVLDTPMMIDLADTPLVVDVMFDVPIDRSDRDAQTRALPAAPSVDPVTPSVDPVTTASSFRFSFGNQLDRTTELLDRTARWLPWVWVVGAPITFLLLASGLVGVERLRRGSEPITSGRAHAMCERLRGSLRVGQRVSVAVSARVVQPVLLGIVRPLILLPPAAITGWTPEQLEMALVHELAHVRRWDNLVNLFQRLVESLLFFHPAVWRVSRWLRADREQCCDATVVRHTRAPEAYADMLIAIAAQSHGLALPLASSPLAQHSLTRRVRRLLQLEDDPMLVSRCTLGAASLAIVALLALVLWQPVTKTAAQESANDVAESHSETTQGKEDTKGEAAGQVITKPDSPSPFMSLSDQRIADLAYKLLNVEIAPLADQISPAVKAEGYRGGVLIESIVSNPQTGAMGVGSFGYQLGLLQPGDILVGLHVWPTADFEQLAEVLRRDDLMEFSPLKFFVLRPIPEPPAPIEEGYDGFEEMSGGGAFGRNAEDNEMGDESKPDSKLELQLITGRVLVPPEAWAAEQQRLLRAKKTDGSVSSQNIPHGGHLSVGAMTEPPPASVDPFENPPREEDAPPPLEQLLYDGRTFDEWRTQWKTELKTEARTEMIKAFAAFARAGYGKQAVKTMLDVAGEYDFLMPGRDTPEGQLEVALLGNLTGGWESGSTIPSTIWLPMLADRYKNDPDRYRWLVVNLISGVADVDEEGRKHLLAWSTCGDAELRSAALVGLLNTDKKREKASTVKAFRRNLTDQETSVRTAALRCLGVQILTGGYAGYAPSTPSEDLDRFLPELLANLFFDDLNVQQKGRLALTRFSKQALQPVAEKLFEVLDDPPASATFLADKTYADLSQEELTDAKLTAIRALAVGRLLGPTKESMLLQLIRKHPDELGVAAGVALNVGRNLGGDDKMGRDAVAFAQLDAEEGPRTDDNARIREEEQRAESLLVPFRVEASKLVPGGVDMLGGGGGGGGFGGGQF